MWLPLGHLEIILEAESIFLMPLLYVSVIILAALELCISNSVFLKSGNQDFQILKFILKHTTLSISSISQQKYKVTPGQKFEVLHVLEMRELS